MDPRVILQGQQLKQTPAKDIIDPRVLLGQLLEQTPAKVIIFPRVLQGLLLNKLLQKT